MESPKSETNELVNDSSFSARADTVADDVPENSNNQPGNGLSNISPSSILGILTVMVIIFILFILWMVSILVSIGTLTATNSASNNDAQTDSIQALLNTVKDPDSRESRTMRPQEYQISYLYAKNYTEQLILNKSIDSTEVPTTKQKEEQQVYKLIYGNYLKYANQEIPMCIVATGRNNMNQDRQKRFLDSVAVLNYGSYRLVYVDDVSDDDSAIFTQQYIKSNRKLKDITVVVQKKTRNYALASKIEAIEDYCKYGEIIIDVDSDDCFIGTEVLSLINYLYQNNENIWILYSNHLILDSHELKPGTNRRIADDEFASYRTSDEWVTSHLKSYRRELYEKIDRKEWLRPDGHYFHWASDRFLLYSMLELAGPKHTQFQNITLYLYDYGAARDVRNFQVIKPDRFKSQLLTPYQPLQSLHDQPMKVANYTAPALLQQYYRRAQHKYEDLAKSNKLND